MKSKLIPDIQATIEMLDTGNVSKERKQALEILIGFIGKKLDDNHTVNLNFICTHNSRRSHLAQVWAQVLSFYCGIKDVYCYSGGTEATALFSATAEALRVSGFNIDVLSEGKNPIYSIKYADNMAPVIGFSKSFNHSFNPQSDFAAIMTCSQADVGCPFIAGAEMRIPITYEDPKVFDGTELQSEKYLERSLQIATELLYVFESI
ncbi:MAG: protein-tyrosine-phosphatase [Saprospirales bacterium]|nr:MAG: protein-tyrosine-phosphatase [Saprospirales bacterium]